jgi:hypothetical protein
MRGDAHTSGDEEMVPFVVPAGPDPGAQEKPWTVRVAPCWPVWSGSFAGNVMGGECPDCGHIDVLHSNARGCVGCMVVAKGIA